MVEMRIFFGVLLTVLGLTQGLANTQISKLYENLKVSQTQSLEGAYAASLVLDKSDFSKAICSTVDQLLKQEGDHVLVEKLHYAANAYLTYGCKIPAEFSQLLESSASEILDNSPGISQLFYILSAASASKAKSVEGIDNHVKQAFESYCDSSKGLCKESNEKEVTSYLTTTRMFEIAKLGKAAGISNAILKPISDFSSSSNINLLKTISAQDKLGSGDDNYLMAMASVFLAAAKSGAQNVDDSVAQKIGESLVKFVEVNTPLEQAVLYGSLKSLVGQSSISQPLILNQVTKRVSASDGNLFVVSVTNVLGEEFSGTCDVKLNGAGADGQKMKQDKTKVYTHKFPQTLKPGFYSLDVTAKCQTNGVEKSLAAKMEVVAQGLLSLENEKIKIQLKADEKVIQEEVLAVKQQLKAITDITQEKELVLTAAVSLSGMESFNPHFFQLVLSHVESEQQMYIPFVDGTAVVTSDKVENQIGTYSGQFSLHVYIGDQLAENGIGWDMGKIDILYTPEADGTQPRPPSPSLYDRRHTPKKEITHVMRPADKRPPAVVSLAFSGIVFVPVVLVLIVGMPVVGVNLRGFPKAASGKMMVFAFHGVLGAMLVFYLYYWLFMYNILKALPLMVGIAVIGAMITSKALTILSEERISGKVKTQ
eukprot:TRINITY_DN4328_c0_g1_i2.p1 TRINITY_DN4328_c0_g1~~TRINITY_DN4328_c0_g1_i2.p1  ORF type:complete len:651 (+),score=68.24 TRINITY_DN4328_c0_g1_i2:79-2031(+)